jgi:hypothetical protein
MTVFHSRHQAEPCARTRSIILADDVASLQRWLGAALATPRDNAPIARNNAVTIGRIAGPAFTATGARWQTSSLRRGVLVVIW